MEKRIIYGPWAVAYKMAEGVWRISDRGQDNMYLVVGSEKALVVDTGLGIENLAEFVKRITPLPTVTVLTHVHLDHAFGNDVFDEVYAGEPELKDLTREDPSEVRSFFKSCDLLMCEFTEFPKFKVAGSGLHARKRDLPVGDGMRFDLGDRQVTAYAAPGHSWGSFCYLDPKTRILFVGDAFQPSDTWGQAWYYGGGGAPLAVFYDAMRKVIAAGGFDWVCAGHGESGLISASHLRIFLEGIRGIIDGKITGYPFRTFAGDGLRCDWEGSSIVYVPEMIR